MTSPVTFWASARMAFALRTVGGAAAWSFWTALVFALLAGATRAAIVATDRRRNAARD